MEWVGLDLCFDNTLTPSEVGTYISNNAYNLNSNTTIGGATILTDVDNTLVGLGLSCQDADIARYDSTLGEWYCDADIDTNTQLSEGQVETFITNGSTGLANGSQWAALTSLRPLRMPIPNSLNLKWKPLLPMALSDWQTALIGRFYNRDYIDTDQNTQLSESQVETFVTNGSIGLANGSTMGGSTIVTTATDSDTLAGLNCSTDEVAKWNGSQPQWQTMLGVVVPAGGLSYSAMYQRTAASGVVAQQLNVMMLDDILISGGAIVLKRRSGLPIQ